MLTNLVLSEYIAINGTDIYSSFKYLGHEICIGRNNKTYELVLRIRESCSKIRSHLMPEKNIFYQFILPVLTGAETLTPTRKTVSKRSAAQRVMEHAMFGIYLTEDQR